MKRSVHTLIDRYYAEDFNSMQRKGVVRAKTTSGKVLLICLADTREQANEIAIVLNHSLDSLKQAANLMDAARASRPTSGKF